ncbi:MAG: prepilin-type N-terminal cleavage/methylation domain-containing protein [Alphaproteobacteria bacterium]|nr:prepilin-type N-terminal cleavage/methylation domain-containing protein [Alphaproteobacteria bacterium]
MKKNLQTGFTLVEMAIVLVLVGILIGGILKGSELINATRMKSVGVQWDNVKFATNAFKAKYGALPGDLRDAEKYISGLTPVVDSVPSRTTDRADGIICYFCWLLNKGNVQDKEFAKVWKQLFAARILNRSSANMSVSGEEGRFFSELTGGEYFLMTDTGRLTNFITFFYSTDGYVNDDKLYLYLMEIADNDPKSNDFAFFWSIEQNTGYALTARQAFEFDKKFDDGANVTTCAAIDDPCNTGSIRFEFNGSANGVEKTPFGETTVAAMQMLVASDR